MSEKLPIAESKNDNLEGKSNEELFKQALVEGLNRRFDKTIEEAKMLEQIEEMAKTLCKYYNTEKCNSCGEYSYCSIPLYAEDLYNAGYQRQSEGCDFCKAGNEKCGTCIKFFDYYEDGGSDRCSSEYGNEKCAYYKPVPHCLNCGAKIKGGE